MRFAVRQSLVDTAAVQRQLLWTTRKALPFERIQTNSVGNRLDDSREEVHDTRCCTLYDRCTLSVVWQQRLGLVSGALRHFVWLRCAAAWASPVRLCACATPQQLGRVSQGYAMEYDLWRLGFRVWLSSEAKLDSASIARRRPDAVRP